jgi:hypothetical protein
VAGSQCGAQRSIARDLVEQDVSRVEPLGARLSSKLGSS